MLYDIGVLLQEDESNAVQAACSSTTNRLFQARGSAPQVPNQAFV